MLFSILSDYQKCRTKWLSAKVQHKQKQQWRNENVWDEKKSRLRSGTSKGTSVDAKLARKPRRGRQNKKFRGWTKCSWFLCLKCSITRLQASLISTLARDWYLEPPLWLQTIENKPERDKGEGGTPLTQIPGLTLQRLMCTTPLRQLLLMCMQLVNCASTSQYNVVRRSRGKSKVVHKINYLYMWYSLLILLIDQPS